MNKKDLVDAVADSTGHSKVETAAVVDAVFAAITDALGKREKVAISGFGTFEARFTAARTARNPQTGASVPVPARYSPKFKPASGLKDAVK
jgi:DNA-binding protein HU-beta